MSSKNFMAYGDAETILTGFANKINAKAKTYILNTGSTDISSTTMIPLVNINNFPDCNVGDIIVLKVKANYTFNKNAGGYWMFKINNIGYEMRLLWPDESDFNQDLPKGSCVVFVYNHNMLYDDFLTVASFDVKNFDPSTVVQKSQTAGLFKNDGTVDTTDYAGQITEQKVLLPSTVGWTGKNLLENTASTTEVNDVTFTHNSDDSISLSGTASNLASIKIGEVTGLTGVILSGCPSGGSSSTYNLQFYNETDSQWAQSDYGDGVTVTLDATKRYSVHVIVRSSQNVTGKTVYPMIRDSRITDSTYEPYHKSVEECLEEINDKLSYLETTATLSTSAATTVTFTSAKLTTSSCVEVGVSEWGLVPDDVTVSTGSCTVTLPKVDSAHTVTVRLYVR